MGRIGRLLSTWKTNWTDDPAARGAAKMTAGVALILEGLFGLSGRVRGKGSGGIMVAIFLIPFGMIFFGVGFFMKPKPFDDEVAVQGTIIDSTSHMNRDSDGHSQRMYKAIYGYNVDGKAYRFSSSVSTNSVPKKGKEVKIAYSASNPNNARRTDGMDGSFHLIFMGVGGLVSVLGLFQLLICTLLIGAGVVLFSAGRKDRAVAGPSEGFFKDLFSLVRTQKANQAAMVGGGVGVMGMPGDGFAGQAGTLPGQGASAMPPAGWMVDPEHSGQMRWWDGAAWTDMRKPVDSDKPEQSDTGGGW